MKMKSLLQVLMWPAIGTQLMSGFDGFNVKQSTADSSTASIIVATFDCDKFQWERERKKKIRIKTRVGSWRNWFLTSFLMQNSRSELESERST